MSFGQISRFFFCSQLHLCFSGGGIHVLWTLDPLHYYKLTCRKVQVVLAIAVIMVSCRIGVSFWLMFLKGYVSCTSGLARMFDTGQKFYAVPS